MSFKSPSRIFLWPVWRGNVFYCLCFWHNPLIFHNIIHTPFDSPDTGIKKEINFLSFYYSLSLSPLSTRLGLSLSFNSKAISFQNKQYIQYTVDTASDSPGSQNRERKCSILSYSVKSDGSQIEFHLEPSLPLHISISTQKDAKKVYVFLPTVLRFKKKYI